MIWQHYSWIYPTAAVIIPLAMRLKEEPGKVNKWRLIERKLKEIKHVWGRLTTGQ